LLPWCGISNTSAFSDTPAATSLASCAASMSPTSRALRRPLVMRSTQLRALARALPS
jgi:hypothetical protein